MEIFWTIYAFLTGLLFGSFANVVIYRLPQGKSIIKPPSACPSCGTRLLFRDLIPVLSWILQKGCCRFCKKSINKRYPLVEVLCGLLFAVMTIFSPTLSVIPLAFFAFMLLTISFIDWDTQEIPDGLLIFGAITGTLWIACGHLFPELFPLAPRWNNSLLGILAGALPLLIIDRLVILLVKKDGFGYGDVKLMAVVGVFLGWQLTLMSFFFAFVIGGAFATYLIATGRAKRGEYMAFGPFLCIGALISLWFGNIFIHLLFLSF